MPATDVSTLTGIEPHGRSRRARRWRAVAVGTMFALVAAALLGAFGPREATATVSEAGYHVSVLYPALTRSGQPAPLELRVEHRGGFRGPLRLTFSGDLFDRMDFASWYPNPSAELSADERVVYEFEPPDGDVFILNLDARTAPRQLGGPHHYDVAVLVGDVAVARTEFRIWRIP